jgi:hypothetical protein
VTASGSTALTGAAATATANTEEKSSGRKKTGTSGSPEPAAG